MEEVSSLRLELAALERITGKSVLTLSRGEKKR
jgi:hypothetical protein